jgi:predicted RNA binding protein YcfA (HicA-like mRNA interferase family)
MLKLIQDDGWVEVKSCGTSHRQYKHPMKPGKVTMSFKSSNDDISKKVESSILKQAGLK